MISDDTSMRRGAVMSTLHARIGQARRRKFSSAEEAAKALQLTVGRYRAYEKGTRAPDHYTLGCMALAFGVSVDWLISGDSPLYC